MLIFGGFYVISIKKLGWTFGLSYHIYHFLDVRKLLACCRSTSFCYFYRNDFHPFLTSYKQLDAGLTYSSKKLLQYAVILLGFGLSISQVFAVGTSSLPVIISTISIALIIAFFFQRFFNLDTKLATLIGVGSSICGGSAIAATAPVIHAKEKEVAQAISVIFSSMSWQLLSFQL